MWCVLQVRKDVDRCICSVMRIASDFLPWQRQRFWDGQSTPHKTVPHMDMYHTISVITFLLHRM